MRGADKGGAQTNDGKVGIAYIEELRFANFVVRLQNKIERIFDTQFKHFLRAAKINIDPDLFFIKLPQPSNYDLFKQAAVDSELINTYNSVEQVDYISKRFALKRYFNWTEEDIQINEALLRQERNIPEGGYDDDLTDIRMIYDPKWKENRPDIKPPANFEADVVPATPEGDGGDETEAEPGEELPVDTSDVPDEAVETPDVPEAPPEPESPEDHTPPSIGQEEEPDKNAPPKL
jgi:hypothetical protein